MGVLCNTSVKYFDHDFQNEGERVDFGILSYMWYMRAGHSWFWTKIYNGLLKWDGFHRTVRALKYS